MKTQLIKIFLATLTGIILIAQLSFGQQWDGDDGTTDDIYRLGNVGIGFDGEIKLSEKLEIYGGVKLGFTSGNSLGTLRWNSGLNRFEGRDSSGWNSLMSYWEKTGNNIFTNVSGNVGIGTTNPQSPLHIFVNNTTVTPVLRLTNNNINGGPAIDFYNSSDHSARIYSRLYQLGDGELVFSIGNQDKIIVRNHDRIGFKGSLAIGSYEGGSPDDGIVVSGNVGIGTPSPGAKLNVMGGKVIIGATSTQIASSTNLEVVNGSVVSIGAATNASYVSFNHDGTISAERTGTGTYQHLKFRTNDEERMRILSNGNVGIGTTNPTQKLMVNGNITVNTGSKFMLTPNAYIVGSAGGGGDLENLLFYTYESGDAHLNLVLKGNGNVGIGTLEPSEKLAVNGKIRAKEIIVNTDWSDFVFEEDYNLRTLSEVEAFIKANKHLPEIPNAKEVEENGVSVGEMQSKLLQKIEELTLYIIEQEKRIKELEEKSTILESSKVQ